MSSINTATEFTNDQLPDLIGYCLAGVPFTAFPTYEAAANHSAIAKGEETAIVTRKDGMFLVAMIDREDGTFIYI